MLEFELEIFILVCCWDYVEVLNSEEEQNRIWILFLKSHFSDTTHQQLVENGPPLLFAQPLLVVSLPLEILS